MNPMQYLTPTNAVHLGLWLALVSIVYSTVVGTIHTLFVYTVLQYKAAVDASKGSE